jgi:hypothetical protein
MAEATDASESPGPDAGGAGLDPRTAAPERGLPSRASRAASALGGRPLTLAAGAAAAAPIVTSTVRAVRSGWEPTDDKAIIATRAYDVLTRHPPLVGQYSMAGVVTGHPTHDLGPTLYWLLAGPARFANPAGMAVTMGAVNVAAVLATVALARARGGRALMLATAVAVPVMSMSLAAETFHDIWNPAVALFPFLLLILLCWSVACGRYRLLPVTALVASFVVQAHLGYLPPTLGMLAIAVVGLAVARRAGRRAGGRGVAGFGVAALLVAVVCWAPTIADEASGHPGNITSVVRTATAPKATLGLHVGETAVVRAVGVRPWWLTVPGSRWDRKHDVRATPSPTRSVTAIALLAALALVAAMAALRRRPDVAAAALIGLVLCAALGAVAAETPTVPVLAATVGYTLWWGSQVGMWVWLVLAWAAWLALVGAGRALAARRATSPERRVRWVAYRRPALASAAGLAAAAIASTAAVAAEQPDQHVALYRPIAAIDARLDAAIPRGHTVRLNGTLDVATQPFKAAVRYGLARRGIRVLSRGAANRNGDWYELDHRRYDTVVTLTDRPRRPGSRASLLVHVRFTERGAASSVFVWLSRRHGGTAPRRRASRHGRRARPAHRRRGGSSSVLSRRAIRPSRIVKRSRPRAGSAKAGASHVQ